MTEKIASKNEEELSILIKKLIEKTDLILHNDVNMNNSDMVKVLIKTIEESYKVEF